MYTKFFYQCNDCGDTLESSQIIYLCTNCQNLNNLNSPPFGVLKTIYDYDENSSRFSIDVFNQIEKNGFIDLLPIVSNESLPYLKIGNTPLYNISSLDNETLDFDLYLKDESQNPTFSVKDRISSIVSAYAKENRIDTLIATTQGNFGSSLAGICAAQKQKVVIFVPSSTSITKLTEMMMYGAYVVPIDGNNYDTYKMSVEAANKFGWYNCSIAFNPLTIEGMKTISFEMFSQHNELLPDRIFVSVGNGMTISGIYKGFEDLLKLRIIQRMPTIVAVQPLGSSNIINNINREDFVSSIGKTIADKISVDIPLNFRMTKKFLNKYNGEIFAVSDEEILAASKVLSSRTGVFAEPSASAAFACFLSYYWDGKLEKGSRNVVLLAGSGLNDLNAVSKIIDVPSPVSANISSIENFLANKLRFFA